MKAFFANIWKYIALVFMGVIAGLVYAMKHMQPVDHIEAGTYVESQDQKIGKMKQRGEGNQQEAGSKEQGAESRKERRRARREERRARRRGSDGVMERGDEKELKEVEDNGDKRDSGDNKEMSMDRLVILVGVMLSFRGWY